MALTGAASLRRAAHAWHPPAHLLAAAQASPWSGDPAPSEPAQRPVGAGVARLERYVRQRFPVVWRVYDRGPSAPNHGPSMHYAGRAFDAMVAELGSAPNPAGDEVANWLLAHARELGVQYLIWRGTQWSSSTGRTSEYPGVNDHFDHVHVDMTVAGARGELPWPPREDSGWGTMLIAGGAAAVLWWLARKRK